MRQLRGTSILVAGVLSSAALVYGIWTPSVRAEASCAEIRDPETGDIVMADLTMIGDVSVVRSGDDILADGEPCGSVTTTRRVKFYDNWGGYQRATISLVGGPFAPGADTSSTPEVNFEYFSTQGCDDLKVVGTADSDYIQWGFKSGFPRANLNANEIEGIDSDLSVLSGCVQPRVAAGDGDDVIGGDGGLGTGDPAKGPVRFDGGLGDDTLTGGRKADTLRGGPGADVLLGLEDMDWLIGADGPDRIDGGAGDDGRLFGDAGRDVLIGGAGADDLDGGVGFDICKGGPGVDQFIDCERVVD